MFFIDRHSWRWRLSARFAALAVFTVTAFGLIAYRTVRYTSVDATYLRLTSGLQEINTVVELGLANQLETLRGVAGDPAIIAALTNAGRGVSASADSALRKLKGRTDAVLSVELRDHDGRVIGRIPDAPPPILATSAFVIPESALIGPVIQFDTLRYFESTAPVKFAGKVLGVVTVVRRLGAASANRRIVANLLGEKAELLFGNRVGKLWSDSGQVEYPNLPGLKGEYVRRGVTWVSVAHDVRGTPWRYVIDIPKSVAEAPARALVLPFIGIGMILAFIGVVFGVRTSKTITIPLHELTAATEALARGERDVPIKATERHDEIGRLARAFDTMAASIRNVLEGLEADVGLRSTELRSAVERLQALDQELQQSERLANLGRLSGSVGHELRNPLGVMSNVVFLLDGLPDSSPHVKECATLLREQIQLSQRIIGDLLDRARSGAPVLSLVHLTRFLDELINRAQLPETIRLERRYSVPHAWLMFDRDQVSQIVWNLLNNAVQAMQGAGTIYLTAEVAHDNMRIEITDSGPGVSVVNLERVFEPMFTTKPDGVGLGLSVSRAFARANGGDLTFRNTPGKGASFVLEIPVTRAINPEPRPLRGEEMNTAEFEVNPASFG